MCRCYFFFFKQKTAYEMRISDLSSDVCSSDLHLQYRLHPFTDDGLCILGEIDGAHQAQRNCDGHGDDRADEDGAPEERDGAKSMFLPKAKRRRLRAPLHAQQDLAGGNDTERDDTRRGGNGCVSTSIYRGSA